MKHFLPVLLSIFSLTTLAQTKETFVLDWPAAEGWKADTPLVGRDQTITQYFRNNETGDNFTEMGLMMNMNNLAKLGLGLEQMMNINVDMVKEDAPDAKLTVIDKNEKAKYPWIIFKIEAPLMNKPASQTEAGGKKAPQPEARLYYLAKGTVDMFYAYVAVPKANLPKDVRDKYTKFFKSGKVINK